MKKSSINYTGRVHFDTRLLIWKMNKQMVSLKPGKTEASVVQPPLKLHQQGEAPTELKVTGTGETTALSLTDKSFSPKSGSPLCFQVLMMNRTVFNPFSIVSMISLV